MEIKTTTFSIVEESGGRKKFMIGLDKDNTHTLNFTDNQWILFAHHIMEDSFDSWVSGMEYVHPTEQYAFKIIPARGPDHGLLTICLSETIYRIAIDFQEINMLRNVIKRGIPKKTKKVGFTKEKKGE